jgi:hypothetical protein
MAAIAIVPAASGQVSLGQLAKQLAATRAEMPLIRQAEDDDGRTSAGAAGSLAPAVPSGTAELPTPPTSSSSIESLDREQQTDSLAGAIRGSKSRPAASQDGSYSPAQSVPAPTDVAAGGPSNNQDKTGISRPVAVGILGGGGLVIIALRLRRTVPRPRIPLGRS